MRTWNFERGDEQCEVLLNGNVTLDSGDALVELAQRDEGVIAVFDFLAKQAIRKGALQIFSCGKAKQSASFIPGIGGARSRL